MSKPSAYRASIYAWMVPRLAEVAREHGYALGVHGSMHRDLDLIAVPWVDEAKPAEDLIEAMRVAVDGFITASGTKGGRWNPEENKFVEAIIDNPSHKPHGRLAWNIHLENGPFVDISVTPPANERNELLAQLSRIAEMTGKPGCRTIMGGPITLTEQTNYVIESVAALQRNHADVSEMLEEATPDRLAAFAASEEHHREHHEREAGLRREIDQWRDLWDRYRQTECETEERGVLFGMLDRLWCEATGDPVAVEAMRVVAEYREKAGIAKDCCVECGMGPLVFSARMLGDGLCHRCGHSKAAEMRRKIDQMENELSDAKKHATSAMLSRSRGFESYQAQLSAAATRVAMLEAAIRTHREQKADDRCIEDDDRLYEALGDGIKCDRRVGDQCAMLENCKRFIANRTEPGGWPTYAELETELVSIREELAHMRTTDAIQDLAAMRENFAALTAENARLREVLTASRTWQPIAKFWTCPVCNPGRGGEYLYVKWEGNVATCHNCGRTNQKEASEREELMEDEAGFPVPNTCHECDEIAVGYDDGTPVCAEHYRARMKPTQPTCEPEASK